MTPQAFQPAIAIIRTVGNQLKSHFLSLTPVIGYQAMMATFKHIDSETSGQIRAALNRAYPDIAWLEAELEENHLWRDSLPARFWICDAIDGAVQFLRCIPHWCISLTLIENGLAQATIIYDPLHDDMFHAVLGYGAKYHDDLIYVNDQQSHLGALLATSQPPLINNSHFAIQGAAASLGIVLREAGAVRNLGPTSLQLAYVASGRLDAFWQYGEDQFNCLGGALLVAEARGRVTDIEGKNYGLESQSIIAAPIAVHNSLKIAFNAQS